MAGQWIGPYLVLAQAGRGGVGTVYRCSAEDGKEVAVKLLSAGADAAQRARFRLEVEALSRLRHPDVIRCLGAGEQDGAPYLVTEWADGETLQRRLERGGPLSQPAAAALVARLARAIEAVHQAGILHRDLNPQNVLLRGEDHPVVTDFGLAKDVLPSASPSASVRGRGMGTPAYWPPEQARGRLEEIGPRSDVYGLGGLLFAALTGQPPHRGDTLLEQLSAPDRLPELDPRLRARVQALDPALWSICMRALAPRPADRHPSAAALAEELARWLAARPS